MSSVVFDPVAFGVRYPQFKCTSTGLLQAYFDEATLYLDNTGCSPVTSLPARAQLLNLLVAHIATLNGVDADGDALSPLVGRISSATEGSVSVSVEYKTSDAASWYTQTKYGAAYWEATKRFRMMRYYPGRSCPPSTLRRW